MVVNTWVGACDVCVCGVCMCLCMDDKERGVLGIEWLLSAVH